MGKQEEMEEGEIRCIFEYFTEFVRCLVKERLLEDWVIPEILKLFP